MACLQREVSARESHGGEGRARPGGDHPVSAAVVTGLAREVDALRQAVRDGAELRDQLADLARTVADLAAEITRQNSRRAGSDAAVSWLDLRNVATRDSTGPAGQGQGGVGHGADGHGDEVQGAGVDPGQVLSALVSWVGRVFLRYPDAAAGLPDCWCWHPEILEELLWLATAWHAAYQGPAASLGAAGDWHDRYRPGVVRRIRTYAGVCSLSNHLSAPEVGSDDPAAGLLPDPHDSAQIAAWWVAGMPGTGPQPTTGQLDAAAARWRRHQTTRSAQR